jgi:hypothetical protein
MFDRLKNYQRFRKFKNRIVRSLPGWQPETGMRLSWDIQLKYKKQYDPITGRMKQIGLAKLNIIQNAPNSILRDNRMYYFDWYDKEIKTSRYAKWS